MVKRVRALVQAVVEVFELLGERTVGDFAEFPEELAGFVVESNERGVRLHIESGVFVVREVLADGELGAAPDFLLCRVQD